MYIKLVANFNSLKMSGIDIGGILGGADRKYDTTVSGESTSWLLVTAFLIFLFQAGSVLVTNAKNANFGNYGLKVIINMAVSIIAWYVTGYAFTYGRSQNSAERNKFIGNFGFALDGYENPDRAGPMFGLPFFFHTWTLALTAATVVANGLGGRATTLAHALTTAYVVLFLFPVSAHWVLSDNGWLSPVRFNAEPWYTGVIDFGAAGPVHLFGGCASLAASAFTMRTTAVPRPADPEPNSLTLGTFLNMFAAFGYITSASLNPYLSTNYAMAAGRAAINLTMTVASTILVTLLAENYLSKTLSLVHASNAVTMGWVVICSNCLTCEPWAALLAGCVAGGIYVGGRRVLGVLKDNDTFLVHGVGAAWGLIFTGFLAKPQFIRALISNQFYPHTDVFRHQKGVFYPQHSLNGELLGLLLLELLTIAGWALFMLVPFFAVLHFSKKLIEPDAIQTPVLAVKEEYVTSV